MLPAFFVRPGTLFIVYSIQIYTLSVPCALRHFLLSIVIKSLLYPFQRVPWGTYSRLQYSNLYSIRSTMCPGTLSIVYCIQIILFVPCALRRFLSKNALRIEYYFQNLNLSVPLWVLRQWLSTIIFKIQNLICNCMRWHLSFLY